MSDISFQPEDTAFDDFMNGLPDLPMADTGVDQADIDILIAELAQNYPVDSLDALRLEFLKEPDEKHQTIPRVTIPLLPWFLHFVSRRQMERRLNRRFSEIMVVQRLQPVSELKLGHSSLLPRTVLKRVNSLRGSDRTQCELKHAIETLTNVNATEVERRTAVENLLTIIQTRHDLVVTRNERQDLQALIRAELTGFGPLEGLMADDSVSEIFVNHPQSIFIAKRSRLQRSDIEFDDNDHVTRIATRLLILAGIVTDECHPLVRAQLPDFSVLQVAKPPVTRWTSITIRKFSKKPLTVEDLIRFGTLTAEIAVFLRACVIARMNILVCGTIGSGSTTLLNVLSGFIPNDERIVSIEYDRQLVLRQEHVVSLSATRSGQHGNQGANFDDLFASALDIGADRLIFGALADRSIIKVLNAIQRGYDGTMLLTGGSDGYDSLRNLEIRCHLANFNLPVRIIRELIASSIDIVVVIRRLRDGSRKITQILDVNGMNEREQDIAVSKIFEFQQVGIEAGSIIGRHRPTGKVPVRLLARIEEFGIFLPVTIFGAGTSSSGK